MGEKALWPTVVVLTVVSVCVTVLLVVGVHATDVIAVFSIAGTVIGMMLYGKLQKVEDNTNGTVTSLQIMLRDLIEHAKNSTPTEPSEKG